MQRNLTIAASALAALMATAAVAAVDEVREIDVTIDLSAIQNESAASYWANLETDLEAAIASRVSGMIMSEDETLPEATTADEGAVPEEGTRILVDIREVELATAFERAMDIGEAVLVGQVNLVDQEDNSNNAGYELSVSLEGAGVVLTEGKTMEFAVDDTATYQLLVDAFADGVVARLD